MSNDLQPVSDDLRRARRNMMVLSIVIITLKLGGVSISEFAVLGTKLVVENAVALYSILWVIFAYFVWRYIQRMIAEPDLGIQHENLQNLSSLTFQPMREYAFTKFPEAREHGGGGFHIGQLPKAGPFKRKANVVVGQNTYGDQEVKEYTLNLLSRWLWPYHVRTTLYVLLVGSLFTEHLLPPLLAIIAVLVGFSGWEGSVLSVIEAANG